MSQRISLQNLSILKVINNSQVDMIIQSEKVISRKANRIVYEHYHAEACLKIKQKIITESQQKMKLYAQILDLIPQQSSSQLSKYLSQYGYEFKRQNTIMIIKRPLINGLDVSQTLKDSAFSTNSISKKSIAELCFQLIQRLVNDGNRPFLPTCRNIFLNNKHLQLNEISFVGIGFLQLKQDISKQQFMEICPLLASDIFQSFGQNLEHDYIKLKQRAIVIFILTLLSKKEIIFDKIRHNKEKVTVLEGIQLLKTQKILIQKYISLKPVALQIQNFEDATKLRLRSLVKMILVDQQALTWPQFISELTNRPQYFQASPKLQNLQNKLKGLAGYHWKLLSDYSKRRLMEDKWISFRENFEQLRDCETDFFLLRLTKLPIRLLMQQITFARILDTNDCTNVTNYNIWTNFIKILLRKKGEYFQSLAQSYQAHLTMKFQEYNYQSNYIVSQQRSKYLPEFHFLLDFTSKKLNNTIRVQSKIISFEHDRAKGLTDYMNAFR